MLAIGATALLLLMIGEPSPAEAPMTSAGLQVAADPPPQVVEQPLPGDTVPSDTVSGDTVPRDPADAAREATGTLRDLALDFYALLPVMGIAVGLLLLAAILAKLVGLGLRSALASWERAQAFAALVSIFIWLLAIGAALSVLAGDTRVLVGSVGLFGLALSWALQAPIESFTGWLLNSFRSYYRVGDRIAVGDVFGDVVRIDFLTTTVFEAGGPDKPVQAAQSTGALVTFPNLEVLRANIINFTRDFPYVWDELTITVSTDSDLSLAVTVLQSTAAEILGSAMAEPAEDYAALLERARVTGDAATRPQVFAAARDFGIDLTIRYLVPAREMRRWASKLLLAVQQALAQPDVAERVSQPVPRVQLHTTPPRPWMAREGDAGEDAPS
jgi:small-conductance mechanosensitive channel